jgi:hypothetical protein
MASQSASQAAWEAPSAIVPLIIGVTGHRDLVADEVPQIRERLVEFFGALQVQFPDRPIRILSGLAEGADQLVTEVALDLGLHVTAVLPMPFELYAADFTTPAARKRFEQLLAQATDTFELGILTGATPERLAEPGLHRNRQYAQLGVFLCAHCHILLALWNGELSTEVGGTAQVIRFHQYDVMSGYASSEGLYQQMLADDDTDLVYHIVVSRDREDGAPHGDLEALQTSWMTTDESEPRTSELPARYAEHFERSSEFNRDVRKHAQAIRDESYPLISERGRSCLPTSVSEIDAYFCAADWLAIFYQGRFMLGLKCMHALIFLMAILFLTYSEIVASRYVVAGFGFCLVLSLAMQTYAGRQKWHDKFLEYRTLAEGLRVQFYWAAAGVTTDDVTKYGHDNFLQSQDVELGWIRNVLRAAGLSSDIKPNVDAQGLELSIDEWIGDEGVGGQLHYYRRKAKHNLASTARAGELEKGVAVLVAALLIGSFAAPLDSLRQIFFIVLGIVLITAGIRDAYAFRVAEKEIIKQYEFMYRIFRNAKRRLAGASTDEDRRRILRRLGEAALDEHAEWILTRRERPLSSSQLWRMEG